MRALCRVLERGRERAVQRHAFGGKQPLVDDLADQAVPEREPVGHAHEHARVEPRAQRVRCDRQLLQHRVRGRPADGRHGGEHVVVEPRDPQQHGLCEGVRLRAA